MEKGTDILEASKAVYRASKVLQAISKAITKRAFKLSGIEEKIAKQIKTLKDTLLKKSSKKNKDKKPQNDEDKKKEYEKKVYLLKQKKQDIKHKIQIHTSQFIKGTLDRGTLQLSTLTRQYVEFAHFTKKFIGFADKCYETFSQLQGYFKNLISAITVLSS